MSAHFYKANNWESANVTNIIIYRPLTSYSHYLHQTNYLGMIFNHNTHFTKNPLFRHFVKICVEIQSVGPNKFMRNSRLYKVDQMYTNIDWNFPSTRTDAHFSCSNAREQNISLLIDYYPKIHTSVYKASRVKYLSSISIQLFKLLKLFIFIFVSRKF